MRASARLVLALALVATALGPGWVHAQQRPVLLDRLDPYVGSWRTDPRTGPDGRAFHFTYRLVWFDPARTLVEMTIRQVFDDGEDRLLWTGFKGWDRAGDEPVYYRGFSPGGRAAAGAVRMDGEQLVTEYAGWGPTGPVVRIRDVFGPVVDGSFESVTLVERDGGWREVMRDRWVRSPG